MAALVASLMRTSEGPLVDPASTYDYACRVRTRDEKQIEFSARISGPKEARVARIAAGGAELGSGERLPVRLLQGEPFHEVVNVEKANMLYGYGFDSSFGDKIVIATASSLELSSLRGRPKIFVAVGFCDKREVELEGMRQ